VGFHNMDVAGLNAPVQPSVKKGAAHLAAADQQY